MRTLNHKMSKTSEKCGRLERVLKGRTSAVLELDSSEENIDLIKNGLKKLGYKVSSEIKNEQQGLYHLHIIKSSACENA